MQIGYCGKVSLCQTNARRRKYPTSHMHLLEMCITRHQHTDALQTARSGCFMNGCLSSCVLKKNREEWHDEQQKPK